jgi:hypothetical protein
MWELKEVKVSSRYLSGLGIEMPFTEIYFGVRIMVVLVIVFECIGRMQNG